jgi:uncharacterized protein DUF6798
VNARSPRGRVWAAAAALAVAAAAWNAWTRRGQVCGPVEDETLLVPLALRHAGLATYSSDGWLATVGPVFSVPYSWLLGHLLAWIDDPVVALRWLALPFHAVFLAGAWRLAERTAGRAAGPLAAVLCALPPFAPLVLAPGGALPRDLVFALVPWLVVASDAVRGRAGGTVLWFGLGVVANLHPLTALHAVMWLVAMDLARDASPAALRPLASRCLGFVAGASPYIAQYLSRPAGAGAADEAVYAWRLGSMAGETWGPWATRMEPLLWLAAAAAVLASAARRDAERVPRWFVAAGAAAFVLAAIGPVAGGVIAVLRPFQFERFERFADLAAIVLVAGGAVAAWRARRHVALVAAAALAALAVAGPGVLGDDAGRGPVGRLGRAIDRRAGVPAEPPPPPGLAVRGAPDPTAGRDRGDFLAVCRFAREATPEGALFLVPPENWGPFRVYARRGVVVTRKEGGAVLAFLGGTGIRWFREYAEAAAAYARDDAPGLAARRRADYVVLDAASGREAVFRAGRFAVVALPAK